MRMISKKNTSFLDSWEQDEFSENSLAPLSNKQIRFIDSLISLTKENVSEKLSEKKPVDISSLPSNKFLDNEEFLNFQNDERFIVLKSYFDLLNKLSTNLEKMLLNLKQLEGDYLLAVDKTKSFYYSCDNLLQQQNGLIIAIDSFNEKLSYFEDLETMSKKFSSPTMLTLNESLVPLLNRLDECINFMAANENNYLEAGQYLNDYARFQSSALNIIRTHVINTLKQTAKQVMPENDTVLTSNESVFTLYYGKFQTNAHRIKTLMQQIEHRTNQSETYNSYLNDCHQCYFQIRDSLISPVLSLAMEEMISTSSRNFCSLICSSAKLYIHICRDEYQLYFQFFTQVNNTLSQFLDKLCMTLYDKLRPIAIHLEHLESLSEICALIKFEFIEENLHQDELEFFVKAMKQLLQDTQERLVYRCNIYIENNILNYMPTSGDLAYPMKLELMKSISENVTDGASPDASSGSKLLRNRSDSVNSIISSISDISFVRGYNPSSKKVSSNAIVDLHGMWYPTVRSAIMCLSKLYRCLDKVTFQGLSQDVLLACIESLERASKQIKEQKGDIDGHLFIIKYLLIIREQIAPFQIESSIKEVYLDFTKTKSAVKELLQKRSNLFSLTSNNALLKLIFEGTPQVSEKNIDSQKAIDNKIKEKCEQFIMFSYQYLSNEIRNLIITSKFEPVESISSLQSQKQMDKVKELENYKVSLQKSIREYQAKKTLIMTSMSLYLANAETEAIIFKQVKNQIQELYEQLTRVIVTKFPTAEERKHIELPPMREII